MTWDVPLLFSISGPTEYLYTMLHSLKSRCLGWVAGVHEPLVILCT